MAAAAATLKKVSMELGGKNPQVIFPDADMDAALDAAAFGAYFNAGECCNAGSRILLHAKIADEFLAALADRAVAAKVGDPLDPETRVGAIITADHLGKIESHVKTARKKGAVLRTGGARLQEHHRAPRPGEQEVVHGSKNAVVRYGHRRVVRSPGALAQLRSIPA